MNYAPFDAEQFYEELENIDNMLKTSSGYIVIFDPIS